MTKSPSSTRPTPFLLIIGIPASIYGLLMFVLALGYFRSIHGAAVLFVIILVLSGSIYLLTRIKKRSKLLNPLIPSLLIICIWIAFGIGVIVHQFEEGAMMLAFISTIGWIMANMGSLFIKIHFRALRRKYKSKEDSLESASKQVEIEAWIVICGLILSILGFLILCLSLWAEDWLLSVLLSLIMVGMGAVAFILEGFFTLIRVWDLKSHSDT